MAFRPPIDWGVLPCATPILEPLLPAKPELTKWQSLHEVPRGSDKDLSLNIWLPKFSRRVSLAGAVQVAEAAPDLKIRTRVMKDLKKIEELKVNASLII
jgi:hypothetical protein